MTNKIYLILSIGVAILLQSCGTIHFRSNYKDANSLLHGISEKPGKPFLKAHLKNGDVCILRDTWKINDEQSLVTGNGIRYDFNRKLQEQGELSIPFATIALFETNQLPKNPEGGRIAALSLLAGVDVVLGVICITNPKACYGSCPTFYLDGTDNFHYANAEGFSNAILPSMEYADIDALGEAPVPSGVFHLTMKNEALETHNIRELKLLGVPAIAGQRVYQSPDNRFFRCGLNQPPISAWAREGEISGLLDRDDRLERFSKSDPNNLNSKEEIVLSFNVTDNIPEAGLLLHFRQTLITTYLFYNAMGYMGNEVGDLFARLETDAELRKKFDATTRLMGGINVSVKNPETGKWDDKGTFLETGPIAINRQLLSIGKTDSGTIQVKLLLNRGLWRLDYAALVSIINEIDPEEFRPIDVSVGGASKPELLDQLFAADRHLTSMPGNEFRFEFRLPESVDGWELFLYSKGYYLEWMRQHWIKDKNLTKLRQMVQQPERFLRREASAFKRYEAMMETQFWNSRIDTRTFTYENH